VFTRHYSENGSFVIDETQHVFGSEAMYSPERDSLAVAIYKGRVVLIKHHAKESYEEVEVQFHHS
jgi:hypothetical protein